MGQRLLSHNLPDSILSSWLSGCSMDRHRARKIMHTTVELGSWIPCVVGEEVRLKHPFLEPTSNAEGRAPVWGVQWRLLAKLLPVACLTDDDLAGMLLKTSLAYVDVLTKLDHVTYTQGMVDALQRAVTTFTDEFARSFKKVKGEHEVGHVKYIKYSNMARLLWNITELGCHKYYDTSAWEAKHRPMKNTRSNNRPNNAQDQGHLQALAKEATADLSMPQRQYDTVAKRAKASETIAFKGQGNQFTFNKMEGRTLLPPDNSDALVQVLEDSVVYDDDKVGRSHLTDAAKFSEVVLKMLKDIHTRRATRKGEHIVISTVNVTVRTAVLPMCLPTNLTRSLAGDHPPRGRSTSQAGPRKRCAALHPEVR